MPWLNGVDDKKISVDGIDVYCATGNVDECQKWGKTLSSAVRALDNIIGRDLKVLAVVTSGMQVLMLSAFEVLRKYDGIAAVDVKQPLSKNLYSALYSIAELAIRKDYESSISRWALEGMASALALEALRISNENAFREVLERISSEKCVYMEEFFSWRFPVDTGKGFTVIGGQAEDAVKQLISMLTKSLEGDIIGHLAGEDKAFYSTAARLFYKLVQKYGIRDIYERLADESTLRKRVEDVYEEACGTGQRGSLSGTR